jgi:FKBP-type peptidyl-prolyl cis-trans isomerase
MHAAVLCALPCLAAIVPCRAPLPPPRAVTTASSLQYEDLKRGEGPAAKAGDVVETHYTIWLRGGQQIESSRDTGRPFTFTLGAGHVIKGWEEGFVGMRVGGKRRLTIPAKLAYGANGAGDDVPPNADLVFEVELLALRPAP